MHIQPSLFFLLSIFVFLPNKASSNGPAKFCKTRKDCAQGFQCVFTKCIPATCKAHTWNEEPLLRAQEDQDPLLRERRSIDVENLPREERYVDPLVREERSVDSLPRERRSEDSLLRERRSEDSLLREKRSYDNSGEDNKRVVSVRKGETLVVELARNEAEDDCAPTTVKPCPKKRCPAPPKKSCVTPAPACDPCATPAPKKKCNDKPCGEAPVVILQK